MRPSACFYADDFTGATASLAKFHNAGLRSVLFFRTPDRAMLERNAADADVIGIAGTARSLAPDDMIAEVEPAFRLFEELGAPFLQYKICSTFDSSPQRGNLATVLHLGRTVFGTGAVPVIPACPGFGRYTVFGQHFAVSGSEVYRLDRHPVMSRHPATPMDEADLSRHLQRQGQVSTGRIDVLQYGQGVAGIHAAFERLDGNVDAIVCDALEEAHLDVLGQVLWERCKSGRVFTLSAQDVSGALGSRIAAESGKAARPAEPADKLDRLLVLSGSASQHNADQIACGLASGSFAEIGIDPVRLAQQDLDVDIVCDAIAAIWNTGKGVVLHSALGPADPRLGAITGLDFDPLLGAFYAKILRHCANRLHCRRALIAGGDTSSWTMRELGSQAMELVTGIAGGGNLCRIRDDGALDDFEVILKGGQVGAKDILLRALGGQQQQRAVSDE